MYGMYLRACTLQEIGKAFGVSRQAVHKRFQKARLPLKPLRVRKKLKVLTESPLPGCMRLSKQNPILRHKWCSRCHTLQSLSQFHKQKNGKYGVTGHCKACQAKRAQQYLMTDKGRSAHRRSAKKYNHTHKGREAKRRYRARFPKKEKAHNILGTTVWNNRISKPKICDRCGGGGQIHGHHLNYNEPLNVIWLCRECHDSLHGRNHVYMNSLMAEVSYMASFKPGRRFPADAPGCSFTS